MKIEETGPVAGNKEEVLVGALGIEPRTNGLKGRCSTIELRTRTQQDVVYQTSHGCSCPLTAAQEGFAASILPLLPYSKHELPTRWVLFIVYTAK